MSLPVTPKVPFGGDYNPEQWPEEVWKEDYRLFDAARIDTVTLGVFTWALTQPSIDAYDFTTLDRIVGRAAAEGRSICLATGTGAHPAWLARGHPEVTRTDFEGRKHRYGQRHNSCPSSPAFRRLSAELAGRIAERYAANAAVVAWHVGNEYGGACYCALCADGFRGWLRERYGTLEALNTAWYTTFWGHRFSDWAEIEPPSALTEHWRGPDHTEPDVVNPVRLGNAEFPARLVFELVIPQGAETVGTYQADFYAGTPAVTRNAFGAGHGWYVATDLDAGGVAWVMREVLTAHGLAGPYAEVPGLESAVRVTPGGRRLWFLLNHNAAPVTVPACATGADLLSGARVERGARLTFDPYGVMIIGVDD